MPINFAQLNIDNYTFTGDVAVIITCLVIWILMATSYVSRTRSYRIFQNINVSLVVAAIVNMVYHVLLYQYASISVTWIYVFRVIYQACLLDVMFLFVLYTTEVVGLDHKKAKLAAVTAVSLMTAVLAIDIIRSLLGYGFRIAEDGTISGQTNIYLIGYILFVILLGVLLAHVRHMVYKRVMFAFYGTIAIAVLVRLGQMALNLKSLTTLSFIFPVIAMMYIMHSNPYDIKIGSLDTRAMEDFVRTMYDRKAQFVFLSLRLPEFDEEGKTLPDDIRAQVRSFSANYFKNCVLFELSHGHVVLIAPKRSNPDYEQKIDNILKGFYAQYESMNYPFKIVIGDSIESVSMNNEYAGLIESVEKTLPINTDHRVNGDDVARFRREVYILSELTDINKKCDLDDPRVLAYCQPVFNTNTGRFDTAEALMRLDLPETGIVQPAEFIPLAEQQGLIHVLTEIILNKTCEEVFKLSSEGYRLSRISVNVSATELKETRFCGDIKNIITVNHVKGEYLAIELTESGNEEDFRIMKEKIDELRDIGLQFYLDDFGTGYSNMQRIMELPFDIIKFDRSMVVASGTGERSEKIVENLAHMFKDMNYSILYEGVEDVSDEQRCLDMSATYLQGYKYSRPVPIERLRDFLQKV